jgi:hypothetical protein
VTSPYGIDIILRAHRQIAMVAVAAILLHPTIIVLDNPSRLELFNPIGGNLASRMAWISVAALLVLVVSSVLRERWSIRYEWWRFSHRMLGVVAIVFAQVHVSMAGLYTNTVWKQAIWPLPPGRHCRAARPGHHARRGWKPPTWVTRRGAWLKVSRTQRVGHDLGRDEGPGGWLAASDTVIRS